MRSRGLGPVGALGKQGAECTAPCPPAAPLVQCRGAREALGARDSLERMQLSVPQRGAADRDSFPVEPDDVGHWLAGLSLASESDAREVHRGLKHSNRLHNDPPRRRAVLERFLPVLDALHERLVELTRAQPLPLVREFARGAALVEALLREEAFAFKILLADGDAAGSPHGADDARRAMRALARRADVAVHGYRRLPDALFEDAHALYALAESHALLDADAADPDATGRHDEAGAGTGDHYRYLLLLAVADTHQLRARQLPLALDFLREAATGIALVRSGPDAAPLAAAPGGSAFRDAFAVDLARGARPERAASLLVDDPATLRLFDPAPVLERIDRAIARTRAVRSNTLGVDVLERQTLGRLRTAFAGERVRRGPRTVANVVQPVLFGHKEITTRLLFDPSRAEGRDGDAEGGSVPLESEGWMLLNRSAQGACLHHPACLPGTVQVGELVAFDGSGAPPARTPEGAGTERANGERPPATLLGTVRWVRSDGGAGVTLGFEYLARGVVPVSVRASDSDGTVTENALIIACKVQQSVVQTVLLPPYLYEVGEQLVATQVTTQTTARGTTRSNRSRRLRLQACLQTNGLFGHFVID